MTTIGDIKRRFKALDINDQAQQAIDDTREPLIEKQKGQLLQGLNAKGNKIGKYRNNKYARVKNQMNPLPGLGTPDLKLTGAFHKGLFVDVRTDTYVIESGDEKNDDLQDKYGTEILGLNKESRVEYVKEDLRPRFLKNVRKKLRL